MSTNQFDKWLEMSGPVAVIVQEELEPVFGQGSVFFPPTFAPPAGSKDAPGYVIDETSTGGVAVVDTVGSQANRMEPLFKAPPYSELVPKARIKIGEREIDLLDAGHRAADAVVRFSDKKAQLREAFLAIKEKRDATPLAKMAPTSIVFGVWDSRDTQLKLPRIVGSTIRAYEVEKLTRSAQYFTVTTKEEREDLGSTMDMLSDVGLNDAPAGRTAGGVISRGGIRKQAILNLVALRALSGADANGTRKLQRYILGLALVALLAQSEKFLREGCLLVPVGENGAETKLVERTGKRIALNLTGGEAAEFAKTAAADFGVGPAWTAHFSKDDMKQTESEKTEKAAAKKTKKAK